MGITPPPTVEERSILESHLPLVTEISNAEGLRDMVIEAWVYLWRQSDYRNVGEAPNFPHTDDFLMRHINAVAGMTKACGAIFEQVYGVTLNHDYLLAGAILHDIDKLVLYKHKGNTETNLKKEVHGQYGARVAEQIGLPPEIVNIIASHSAAYPSAKPESIEALLLINCDQASFQSRGFMAGKHNE
ncbi:HDIG domain-containing metalloprotein [Chloroflexota bacterium]